jgi:hypothetical protein
MMSPTKAQVILYSDQSAAEPEGRAGDSGTDAAGRSTVEQHPCGTLKYRIFCHPRLLLRGLRGAQTEIGIAVTAYNLKRMIHVLGSSQIVQKLTGT